ncbi:MAG: dTMP kinase [Caldiserica bacterium]|nr:MAG: dTMP kinase [Caldisericota bacterium]
MRDNISKIGGYFITFEGIDGCGKSTQAKLLKKNLEGLGFGVFWTKEPGGTDIGEKIRDILLKYDGDIDSLTEFLLFASDRNAHIKRIIEEIGKGKIVISERFKDSSVAYQGYGGGVSISFIEKVHREITLLDPDITFLLDISPRESLKRVKNMDRIEKRGTNFLERVRNGYLILSKMYPERIYVIDGSRSKEEIGEEIFSIVKRRVLSNKNK